MSKAKMRLLYWLTKRPFMLRWALRLSGRLTAEIQVMLDHVQPRAVVFDIGANRGFFTQFFSLLAGNGGRVYAFEPVATTFQMLRERMSSRLVISNVEFLNVALADSDGTATMHLPNEDDGQASLRPHHGAGSWSGTAATVTSECRKMRLDTFVAEWAITRLDFVKCDVEGAELLVLNGGAETLRRLKPAIYLEVCPDWTSDFGYQPLDMVLFLQQIGYKRFFLIDDGSHLLRPAEPQILRNLTASANLLCLPAGEESGGTA